LNIFGLSIAILFNIVLPKILRVLSGEKVVLTHLLARYNQQTAGGLLLEDGSTGEDYRRSMLVLKASSTNGTNSGRALSSTAVYSPGAVVKLKRDDPLPRKLENGIYDVQGLLGQVSRLWYVCFCFAHTLKQPRSFMFRTTLISHGSILFGCDETVVKEGRRPHCTGIRCDAQLLN
jgi:hypothetical protein